MTQDEIILMADASGISLYGMGADRAKFIHYLEAFAKLVAAHTLMNIDPSKFMSHQEGIEAGRLAEREACVKVCERHAKVYSDLPKTLTTDIAWAACIDIRDAIQARGKA